jgi:hypothetical protein
MSSSSFPSAIERVDGGKTEHETYVVDLVEGNVSSVLDVLLLLSVPCGFWKSVSIIDMGSSMWSGSSYPQSRRIRNSHIPPPNQTIPQFKIIDSPFNALMTKEEADGTTATVACRFWMVSWTVTRRPFQSPVAFAISSPIFFGDWMVSIVLVLVFVSIQPLLLRYILDSMPSILSLYPIHQSPFDSLLPKMLVSLRPNRGC